MAASLVGTVTASPVFQYTGSVTSAGATPTESISFGTTGMSFVNGTGANQCSKYYYETITLNNTSRTIDLTNLTGTFAGTITFSKIKVIYVSLVGSGNDGDSLLVGGAASNPFQAPWDDATATEKVMAQGVMLKVNPLAGTTNPWTVDASNCNLKTSTTANLTYVLFLAGV